MVRVLKDRDDEETRATMQRIYQTYSGYVHANYAHIMETYGGRNLNFNLAGISSIQQRQMRMEIVQLAANSVLHAAAFVAQTLDLKDLSREIVQSWHK